MGDAAGQSLIDDSLLTGSCKFTVASNLNYARRFQTAVLLPDGLVLAAAGYGSTYLASAEIYNPANGEWTNTGSMHLARTQQKGVLLPNGLVLVAGGDTNGGSVASTEVVQPDNGNVDEYWFNEYQPCLPHGDSDAQRFGACGCRRERFNPTFQRGKCTILGTATWTNTRSLNIACYSHTATVLPNGLVLVAGGFNASTALTNAECTIRGRRHGQIQGRSILRGATTRQRSFPMDWCSSLVARTVRAMH